MSIQIPKSLREFPMGAIRNPVINTSFPTEHLKTLHIDMPVIGNMLICFDAESEVTVVSSGDEHLLPLQIERVDDVLHLNGNPASSYILQGQKSKILTEVHVPPHTEVVANFKAGVLILNGGKGDLYIRGKFGEVAGITHAKQVNIKLSVGDVSLNELEGAADLEVNLGSATLGWSELKGTERVHLKCGFGGVELILPSGVTPIRSTGREKKVSTAAGTEIVTKIGFGGLDVSNG